MQHSGRSTGVRVAKAGREQVLVAADTILLAGQRPTIGAIQAHLGGGSPNSIVAYLKDWYALLGERLAETQTPAEGLAPEVHQAALALQTALRRTVSSTSTVDTTEALIRSLRAEVLSRQVLLDELRAQKRRDQQALADTRALLLRKDEELERLNQSHAEALAQVAVLAQRLKSRARRASVTTPVKKTKRPSVRPKPKPRTKVKSSRTANSRGRSTRRRRT